jgi:hypothetical protein
MSKEDAVATLTVKYPGLSNDDILDLLSPELSIADKALLVKFYKDAGIAPSASFWDDMLKVLQMVESIANLVIPIASAITGVYGVVAIKTT